MKYYKAFNKDLTCRGFQYKIGETYSLNDELKIRKCGFHFCDILNTCYNYYDDNDNTIICLVEPLGNIIHCNRENLLVTDKIKIVRQLTKQEIKHDRFIIQDGITFIGQWTFNDCKSLESINIPNSVIKIGRGVFKGCKSLESIIIPNSVTSIGVCAFESCISLKEINIPNSVTKIDCEAFVYCKSLTKITVPDSVISIGECCFYNNDFTIYGNKNSYAEHYAIAHHINFKLIENEIIEMNNNDIDNKLLCNILKCYPNNLKYIYNMDKEFLNDCFEVHFNTNNINSLIDLLDDIFYDAMLITKTNIYNNARKNNIFNNIINMIDIETDIKYSTSVNTKEVYLEWNCNDDIKSIYITYFFNEISDLEKMLGLKLI